ncbi:MAG: hypothetical protein GYA62_06230 [Bacteroidales bacterium]|nr:hypothetical protein [Bacteroidales bacterium]
MENKFDIIYHEHVFYYSLIALEKIFLKGGLEIYDVEIIPMQGGSLRIFASHKKIFKIKRNVVNLRNSELKNGYNNLKTYKDINKNIKKIKQELITLFKKIKKSGKTIAAYSAPAKGNILLNYFGIGSNYLDFIVDKAKEKQGFYTPGTHLKVEPIEKIFKKKPDFLLILCWNIAPEIITQMRQYRQKGGKFIIPIPRVKII